MLRSVLIRLSLFFLISYVLVIKNISYSEFFEREKDDRFIHYDGLKTDINVPYPLKLYTPYLNKTEEFEKSKTGTRVLIDPIRGDKLYIIDIEELLNPTENQ